jgi:hypothetical protein
MAVGNGDGPCGDGAGERSAHRSLRRAALSLTLAAFTLALAAAPALALPDGREYEQVTPPLKHGADPRPIGEGFQGPKGGLIQASASGNALTYVADAPVETEPEGNRSGEGNQTLAERSESPAAWTSRDIVTPHAQGEGFEAGEAQEYRLFSPDLNLAEVSPFGIKTNPFMEPPLVAGASSEERSIYRRQNSACHPKGPGCFEALVNKGNVTGTTEGKQTAYGGKIEYLASNPSVSAVAFTTTTENLLSTPGPSGEQGLYESVPSRPPAEQLQLASVLPGTAATPATEVAFGSVVLAEQGAGGLTRNAISEDGSRVFFSAPATATNKKGEEFTFRQLFMRDTATHVTVRLDAAVGTETLTETFAEDRRVTYQGASADGSRIFFTSNASLTPESHVKPKENGEGPVNLYVCEIPTTAPVTESTKCNLHDLTGSLGKGIGDVLGMVSAISDDGATVYFAADGAPEGGVKGKCPNPTSTVETTESEHCHLYVAHLNGETWEPAKLVATVSAFDDPAWGRAGGVEPGDLVARTSPSGRYFTFMSLETEALAKYDNRDVNETAAKGARDEEVFLFDREASDPSRALICVSCNPHREQRPRGIRDQEESGEGFGPRVDPFHFVWGEEGKEQWLAGSIPAWTPIGIHTAPYQSRFLLDNGRLYFNSSDSLVPHEVETRTEVVAAGKEKPEEVPVGVENVYQFEPEGVGSCQAGTGGCVSLVSSGTSHQESAFLDASTSGDNVFFLTSASLAKSDVDNSFDVYDARVCGAAGCVQPPKSPPTPCNDEASCRNGSPSSPPSFGPAPSSTFNGPGNAAKVEVLHEQKSKSKALTKAQKLAKALASCRKKHKHSRHKRMTCERQARKLYAKHASVNHKKGKH